MSSFMLALLVSLAPNASAYDEPDTKVAFPPVAVTESSTVEESPQVPTPPPTAEAPPSPVVVDARPNPRGVKVIMPDRYGYLRTYTRDHLTVDKTWRNAAILRQIRREHNLHLLLHMKDPVLFPYDGRTESVPVDKHSDPRFWWNKPRR